MTTLAAESAVSLLISNNGFLEVATGGGFGSVTITPTGGVAVSEAWGPAPFRKRWTGYPDGAAVSLTNTTSASFDYETDTTNLPLAVQALVQGGGNAPTFVAQAAPSGSGDLYGRFIAEIDAWAAGYGITKIDRGAASGGTKRVYEYRAGSGIESVVLVGGTHGEEVVSAWGALSFFKWFVSDAGAANLRQRFQISYVPALNAAQFGATRVNANGVDINRNYPFYWARFSSADPTRYKGASAGSEPEYTAIKAIMDAVLPVGVIDCHNTGAGGISADLSVSGPGFFNIHNRHVHEAATRRWKKAYSGTASDINSPRNADPTLMGWASLYMTITGGRRQATTLTLECEANIEGSSDAGITAAGASKYGGFIYHWLMALDESLCGQCTITQFDWNMRRVNPNAAVSIASGGTLIDNNAWTAATFDQALPTPDGFTTRDYLDCPLPCNGDLVVDFSGYLNSVGGGDQRVDFGISLDGATPQADSFSSITLAAASGSRMDWFCSARFQLPAVDGIYIPRVQGMILRQSAAQAPQIIRMRLNARVIPYSLSGGSPPI